MAGRKSNHQYNIPSDEYTRNINPQCQIDPFPSNSCFTQHEGTNKFPNINTQTQIQPYSHPCTLEEFDKICELISNETFEQENYKYFGEDYRGIPISSERFDRNAYQLFQGKYITAIMKLISIKG